MLQICTGSSQPSTETSLPPSSILAWPSVYGILKSGQIIAISPVWPNVISCSETRRREIESLLETSIADWSGCDEGDLSRLAESKQYYWRVKYLQSLLSQYDVVKREGGDIEIVRPLRQLVIARQGPFRIRGMSKDINMDTEVLADIKVLI